MSAFIVGKEHIDLMVSVMLPTRGGGGMWWRDCVGRSWEVTRESADAVGRVLWDACYASVAERYPDDKDGELPGPTGLTRAEVRSYVYEPPQARRSAVAILKCIACYEYQSCEAEEWPDCNAKRICDSLYRRLVHDLPGYEAAPWGI
jgi:hypothetical protein